MPRTYAKPTTRSAQENAPRKYRSQSKGVQLSKATAADVPYASPPDTLPAVVELTESQLVASLLADDTSAPHDDDFSTKQVYLLQLYVRYPGDGIAAALMLCEQAGYHPKDTQTAQGLLKYVMGRVEAIGDTRRMMRLMGMGEMQWMKKIFAIANCGSARVEVIAAKLWGLAVGAFDDPVPSSGAKIIIEAGAQGDSGSSAVRVTLEGAGAASKDSDGTVSFSTTKPTSRKKLLRSLS